MCAMRAAYKPTWCGTCFAHIQPSSEAQFQYGEKVASSFQRPRNEKEAVKKRRDRVICSICKKTYLCSPEGDYLTEQGGSS